MHLVTEPTTYNRKTLVTVAALVIGAVAIVASSLFVSDSATGGSPSARIVVIRLVVLTMSTLLYVGVSFYYARRNAAFREKMGQAAEPLPPAPQKK